MTILVRGYLFSDWQQPCLESRKIYSVNPRSERKLRYRMLVKEVSINTRISCDGRSIVLFLFSWSLLVASQL